MYYIYSFHHFLSFTDFCLHTFKIDSPLTYHIPTVVSFLSSPPSPSHSILLPDPLLLCFLPKKSRPLGNQPNMAYLVAVRPGASSHIQTRSSNPVVEKGPQKQKKRVRDSLHFHC